VILLCLLLLPQCVLAEPLRLALFDGGLTRAGPGLLLRDIREREDTQIAATLAVIDEAKADVLVLLDIDWDLGLAALSAFNDRLTDPFPHLFALRPNAGLASGLDLDGDGRLGGPGDAQGYGDFTGSGGMAVLSRLPFGEGGHDFSAMLWRDLPGATLPATAFGEPFPSAAAQAIQRLSSTGHWVVPVALGRGDPLTLLVSKSTPPVFDGPEDRNGLRNADELRLWQVYLEGKLGRDPPRSRIVLAANTNLDPEDGDGDRAALDRLLAATALTDPGPRSAGGVAASRTGPKALQPGDPALDTAEWDAETGPGNLRVDYLLPSADLTITGSGVLWPLPGDPFLATVQTASRHRLLWLDLDIERPSQRLVERRGPEIRQEAVEGLGR